MANIIDVLILTSYFIEAIYLELLISTS